jgi:hypothetical protein
MEPDRKSCNRSFFGLFSGLNALETIVVAAIVLVALAGAMLVGKGLFMQSRLAAAPHAMTGSITVAAR